MRDAGREAAAAGDIHGSRLAESGGVVSYGPDLAATYERAGAFVAKILRGANPAELPIERPTKFTLVVNLKAAKALNLTAPDSILTQADKVVR